MDKRQKEDYVKMPDSFHAQIEETLSSLDCVKQDKRKTFPKAVKIALIAAAMTVVLTVSVFASSETVQETVKSWLHQIGKHQVALSLEDESKASEDENGEAVKTVPYVKVNLGWLPENIIPLDPPYKYTSTNGDGVGGLTFILYEKETAENLDFRYVGSVTETMFGERKGAVIRYADSGSRELLIYFDDFGYVLRCMADEDVSDEELLKIAENISLEETDKANAFIVDTYISGVEEISVPAGILNKNVIHKSCGDTISFTKWPNEGFRMTVQGVQVCDNVSNLDMTSINKSYRDEIDELGNLKPYERKTYRYGDGIDTLNVLEKSEIVGRRLVLVEMTVENRTGEQAEYSVDGVLKDSVTGEYFSDSYMFYISGQNGDSGRFFFVPVAKDETKTVTVGFLVDSDKDLSNLAMEIQLNADDSVLVDLSR